MIDINTTIDTTEHPTDAFANLLESDAYKQLQERVNYINKAYQEIMSCFEPQLRRIVELYRELIERLLPTIDKIDDETSQTFTSIEAVSIQASSIVEDEGVPRAPPTELINTYIVYFMLFKVPLLYNYFSEIKREIIVSLITALIMYFVLGAQ